MRRQTRAPQTGQVMILTALSLVAAIGTVGLAIDSGLGYMVRAKLNAAVDSAAVAAARAVSKGADQAAQTANARQAAREFFSANYPSGYLGSVPALNEPIIGFDGGKVTIDVSAQAVMPVSFMRVLGFNQLNVGAASQTVRKDLDLAFAMDASGSMSSVAAQVRAAGVSFLEKFGPTTDRIALIHFAAGGVVDDAIRTGRQRGFDRPALERHVNNLDFTGKTNYAEGLWHARDQLNRIAPADRSTLRVIVFFSDGSPNSFSSYFAFKNNPGTCNLPVDPANPNARAGTIQTGDNHATGDPDGLNRYDLQDKEASSQCDRGYGIANAITGLPSHYNAHDPRDTEFGIVPGTYRTIGNAATPNNTGWKNINLAARELSELMADKAKSEGIFVFTLGLGKQLKQSLAVKDGSGIDTGEELLKCMANTAPPNPPDGLPARCHDAAKPMGVYCYAATENDLKPCFAQLASEILRISR